MNIQILPSEFKDVQPMHDLYREQVQEVKRACYEQGKKPGARYKRQLAQKLE